MNNRNRLLYLVLVAGVVALGLASRHFPLLPSFVHLYIGDALWALMVFLIFGFLFPKHSTMKLALYAVCFSYCIEFSQLYHAPWIDGIRANRLGRLVLGFGFLWSDLIAYLIGISLGALCEWAVVSTRRPLVLSQKVNES